jgi:hypothetical protein
MALKGPAGVGKTTAALQFPNSYVIDMEKGTDYYSESMNKSGSAVLQTVSAEDIKNEIRALLTEKHEYRTLIIDPITQLYNSLQDKWTRIFEKHSKSDASEIQDFGMRYWGRVKAEYKSIQRMLLSLDMNVIITSHQKDVYGAGMQKVGVGPDSMKGDSYVFDMVFRLDNINGKRIAFTEKERAEIGKNKFPESFEWSYANFTKFYGQDIIERVAAPVVMATKEQVAEVTHLLDVVKVDDTVISDWFTKADVETWDEMQGDKIQKCIDFIKKKIQTTEVK